MPAFGVLLSRSNHFCSPSQILKQARHCFQRGLPNGQSCVRVRARVHVFFFHALGSKDGVSHDGSFLGVVTTFIVTRLSSRTLLSFWVRDISRYPPQPPTFTQTHRLFDLPANTQPKKRNLTGLLALYCIPCVGRL